MTQSQGQLEYLLLKAAADGASDDVARLVTAGADCDANGPEGATPLIVAAQFGRSDVIQKLLEFGAEVNRRDDFGATAVMWAAEMGHCDIVRTLVENGADLKARSRNGLTALTWAATQWQFAAMHLIEDLLEKRPLTLFFSYSRKDCTF